MLALAVGCADETPSVVEGGDGGEGGSSDSAQQGAEQTNVDDANSDALTDAWADAKPDTASPDTKSMATDASAADSASSADVAADTSTPPETCSPRIREDACRVDSAFPVHCGTVSDGCGGTMKCDSCDQGRCARGGTVDAGYYFEPGVGICVGACHPATPFMACTDATGVEGLQYDCNPSWTPVTAKCVALARPSPDAPSGSTGWCCPSAGAEW
jgi:hypothetical protein